VSGKANHRMDMTNHGNLLERFSQQITCWAGGSLAFTAALAIVVVWAASGPFFGFSETWQLVINTGTTIITFLMVFLIQRSQNKESLAIQLKLSEIVAAISGASNRLIDAEELGEKELETLRNHYQKLTKLAAQGSRLTDSHSIEEAQARHARKHGRRRPRTRAASS